MLASQANISLTLALLVISDMSMQVRLASFSVENPLLAVRLG